MMHRHTLCCDKANSCQSDDGTLMGKKKMLFDITSSCLICNLEIFILFSYHFKLTMKEFLRNFKHKCMERQ